MPLPHDPGIEAVRRIASVWRTQGCRPHPSVAANARAVVRRLATVVRERGPAEAEIRRNDCRSLLLPALEPSQVQWNVFRFLGLAHDEPRWTRWLAGILDPKNGDCCSRLVWRAFCRIVIDEYSRRESSRRPPKPIMEGQPLGRKQDWDDAVNGTVEFVTSEYSEAGAGSIDILMRTPCLAIGLENKLWEHWHDGRGERGQAERYRGLVDRYRRQQALPRFALVLLTCREGLQPGASEDYPEDWLCVTWYDLGRALRSELKQVITGTHTLDAALDLWPVVLTLVSLERDLLGLAHDAVHAEGSDWRSLTELERLHSYLEE